MTIVNFITLEFAMNIAFDAGMLLNDKYCIFSSEM